MAKSHTIRAAGTVVTVEIDETTAVASLDKLAERLGDMRRFFRNYWAVKFFNDILQNFETEGGSVGGWRALSPRYAAWKRRVVGNRPILQFSRNMRESFVIGNPNNVLRVTKTHAEAGSRLQRAYWHTTGTSRLPRRRVIFLAPAREYNPILRDYLHEELESAGFRDARRKAS